MQIKFMPKLTNRQKRAFGFSEDLTDPLAKTLLKMTDLFASVDKQNFELEDQGQYYDEFMSMKGIIPNQEGTGRINFDQVKKVHIGFIHKGRKKTYSQSFLDMVGKFITIFYGVPTSFRQLNLKVVKGGVQDTSRSLLYHINSQQGMLDALQILDMLIDIQSTDQLLIAFIDNQIHQQGSSIYGRACANRVGIIDISIKDEKQKLIETLIHQSLHTFGFDHCVAWKCLMNPYVSDQLWLCPCCLRKLLSQTNKPLKQFVSEMMEACEQFDFQSLKKTKKISQRLAEIEQKQENDD